MSRRRRFRRNRRVLKAIKRARIGLTFPEGLQVFGIVLAIIGFGGVMIGSLSYISGGREGIYYTKTGAHYAEEGEPGNSDSKKLALDSAVIMVAGLAFSGITALGIRRRKAQDRDGAAD